MNRRTRQIAAGVLALALAVSTYLAVAPEARAETPAGQITWALHFTLAPTLFEPAETPGLITSAVEELLRYDGPVQRTARVAGDDVTIGGRTIPKGDMVMPFIGAADRDPAQFPDPDRLDLARVDNRHIAFGWGIHFCIGAPLARQETRITFERLLARVDHLELAGEPQRNDSYVLHGLTHLPLRWTVRQT